MTVKKDEDKLFDLRTLDASLARGLIKPADYDKYLKALPDEEGNYDLVEIQEDEEEEDEEENLEEELNEEVSE